MKGFEPSLLDRLFDDAPRDIGYAFICHSLELAISRHEPRLINVHVVLDQDQRTMGALRFSISALLVVHPSREPVNFDAFLQPTTLQYSVSRNRRAAAI
ncbi:MAG: type VI secretion system baseplate subunit TssE [Acidihalobacter sp.]|uniref:type VI secretion system baseplate subunit TssE n=1 Tax=Acidihalobacter sp. TaxID=1872108 RepID=UPI00307D4876